MDDIKRRLTERQNSDAHETNFDHIEKARASYLWAASNYDNFKIVSGVENDKELTPEEIHEKVWELTRGELGL